MDIDSDSPNVKVPPPIVLLLTVVFGALLEILHPTQIQLHQVFKWFGALGVLLSAYVVGQCASRFKSLGTHIKPWKTTTALEKNQFYAYSRNPIYVSFVVFGVSTALLLSSSWILILQVPLVLFLRFYVIEKEEKYLEKKFGTDYLTYKNKVRRWV